MWEVKIQDAWGRLAKEITIFRKIGEHHEVMCNDFKSVETIKAGDPIDVEKHTIIIQQEVFEALVNSVHENFKPSEGKFTEGKLEATESHLSDLRQLLKLK